MAVEQFVTPGLIVVVIGYLYRVDKTAHKAVRLLEGEDEVEGDGVLARLDETEAAAEMNAQELAEHRRALRREDILDASTDGGTGEVEA